MKFNLHNHLVSVQLAAKANRLRVLSATLVFCCYHSVFAAEFGPASLRDTLYFSTPPGAHQIGRHLFPEAPVPRRTRSITFAQPTTSTEVEKSVGMPVLFHFGKTTIVEQSRAFLDDVGEMMIAPEYANRTLIVEGHTDAVGSEQHNQRLSVLRALAIKQYLVTQFGIDPLRLFPAGKGESALYDPQQPSAEVNRRVEFMPYQQG